MTVPAYSDEEIHGLLRQAVAEQNSAPTPTPMPMSRRSVSGSGVRRELSFDEILQKIQGEYAGER
jgi:hypothetical protein